MTFIQYCKFILIAVFLFAGVAGAHASPDGRKTAILSTMAEATLATTMLAQDRKRGSLKELKWSTRFSERDWSVTATGNIDGEPFTFTIVGYLWGDDQDDWQVTFAGAGRRGTERIRINGIATWKYDEKAKDHTTMAFRHTVKFGENSIWGWVVGTEIIVGGALAGVGAAAAITASTAGIGIGAAIVIGVAASIPGAGAAVTLSKEVTALVESDKPAPAPAAPKAPNPPKVGDKLTPTKDSIHIGVSRDGRIFGNGPEGERGTLVLSGDFKDDGTGNGTIILR